MDIFNFQDKIVTLEQFQNHRSPYQKIVFTNGCFDILHLGHIAYLLQARKQGDCLVIGLNTDASVKRLKGINRPINNQYARAILLAALQFVDFVILFDEDTPLELINAIQPQVLVKGADYKIENIVGADVVQKGGGEVITIDFIEGYSSTFIINQMIDNEQLEDTSQ